MMARVIVWVLGLGPRLAQRVVDDLAAFAGITRHQITWVLMGASQAEETRQAWVDPSTLGAWAVFACFWSISALVMMLPETGKVEGPDQRPDGGIVVSAMWLGALPIAMLGDLGPLLFCSAWLVHWCSDGDRGTPFVVRSWRRVVAGVRGLNPTTVRTPC